MTVSEPGTFFSVTWPTRFAPKFRVTVRLTSEVPRPAPRPQPVSTTAPATAIRAGARRRLTGPA